MIELIPKLAGYKLFRRFGWPKMLPLSITINVTERCNSRCKTCKIWRSKTKKELSLNDYKKIFSTIGKPYWVTVTGGEPFIRKDLANIVKMLYHTCKPKVVTIPSNGIMHEKIEKDVSQILSVCRDTRFIINLSLDEIGKKHDKIRGVRGNFESVIKTYEKLRNLNYPNLTLGMNTVISNYNISEIDALLSFTESLGVDSHVFETAELRKELKNERENIVPSQKEALKALGLLISKRKQKAKGLPKIIHGFRRRYYNYSKKILKQEKQILPCYAGFASAQISSDGDVWVCCMRCETLGNLRQNDYDFKGVWFGKGADRLRKAIKKRKCFCTMANIFYVNMICNTQSFLF
jgi:MoaA/NifB/PqqE/SkfB family radical SAM enzyme